MNRYFQVLLFGLAGSLIYISVNDENANKMIASILFMIYCLLLVDGTKDNKK